MLNNAEASREIRRLFYGRWVTDTTALNLVPRGSVITYIPEVRYEEVQEVEILDSRKHFCYFRLRNVATNQVSLAGSRIEEVGTRYTTRGIVIVDLFFSKESYKTNDKDSIELITQEIFFKQSTPNGVWFRNPTIIQLDPEAAYLRSMVTVDYTFDTIVL